MIRSIVEGFPAEWLMEVTVVRGGGLDRFNNPIPSTRHTVSPCLIGDATSEEREDFSEVANLDAVLAGPVRADVVNTDLIEAPATAYSPARKWRVTGHPTFGPLGTKVPLSKEP